MRKLLAVFLSAMIFMTGMRSVNMANVPVPKPEPQEAVMETKYKPVDTARALSMKIEKLEQIVEPEVTPEPEPIIEPEITMSQKDIDLIALVTMAEAEGESELGKRLVIDTVLNRMDHSYWPDSAHGVIYQKSQFTSMWNGRVNRCHVRDDIVELVKEELVSRTNDEVVFFRTSHYSKYGQPLFREGNHYFSSY